MRTKQRELKKIIQCKKFIGIQKGFRSLFLKKKHQFYIGEQIGPFGKINDPKRVGEF